MNDRGSTSFGSARCFPAGIPCLYLELIRDFPLRMRMTAQNVKTTCEKTCKRSTLLVFALLMVLYGDEDELK